MRRAKGTGQLAADQSAAGLLPAVLLAAVRPPPSRYRNPGDVVRLIAAVAAASPTPGGLGSIEAALIAALTGIGIHANIAVPVVITYRLATYWLPIAPGWACLQLLQRRDLL